MHTPLTTYLKSAIIEEMISSLVLNSLVAIAGLWVAVELIEGVSIQGPEYTLLIAGGILGILHTVAKPILNLLTLPLRIITLGISGFFITVGLVWGTEIAMNTLYPGSIDISGLLALFQTSLLVWGATFIISLFKR